MSFEVKRSSKFLLILGFALFFANIMPTLAYWREEAWYYVTEDEWIPTSIIYDPPGTGSFQEIVGSSTASIKHEFYSSTSGVTVSGSTTKAFTFSVGQTSSKSSDPNDMGPGKGDRVIGNVFRLKWYVHYVAIYYPRYVREKWDATLVDCQKIGYFLASRSDCAAHGVTNIEDKTGTPGSSRHYEYISAYSLKYYTIKYSFTGTFSLGAKFEVNFGISVKIGYTCTVSGTMSHTTKVNFYSQYPIECWMESNQANWGSISATVQDYIFWFSPA